MPLNPTVSPPELQHLLADCEARAVVTTAASLDLVRVAATGCSRLEWLIVVEDGIGGDALPLSRLRATRPGALSVRRDPTTSRRSCTRPGARRCPKE